jgi:5,6-dimethylbenzimidazole synthase
MTHCSAGFSVEEKRGIYRAIYERRDVRSHFLPEPVPDDVLARILDAAHHAPSVGFMQPWDFIVIRDSSIRNEIRENFENANRQAAAVYDGEKRSLYESLKLAAIVESPMNLCITCDHQRSKGAGLGRQSNPSTDIYSTVCAVQNLWLAARAESIGVGWVSILDTVALKATLQIPPEVIPVAYLCIGYVSEFGSQPELEKRGWEQREALANLIHYDRWTVRPS